MVELHVTLHSLVYRVAEPSALDYLQYITTIIHYSFYTITYSLEARILLVTFLYFIED